MSEAQIFQILGLIYVAMGVAGALHPGYYSRLIKEFAENSSLMMVGGMASLVIGYLLVQFYSVWVWDWPVIITVIGWLAMIKGFLLLALPGLNRKACLGMAWRVKLLNCYSVIILLFGALMLLIGIYYGGCPLCVCG